MAPRKRRHIDGFHYDYKRTVDPNTLPSIENPHDSVAWSSTRRQLRKDEMMSIHAARWHRLKTDGWIVYHANTRSKKLNTTTDRTPSNIMKALSTEIANAQIKKSPACSPALENIKMPTNAAKNKSREMVPAAAPSINLHDCRRSYKSIKPNLKHKQKKTNRSSPLCSIIPFHKNAE